MDSEWIDARVDGSDLRVGDLVRLSSGAWVSIARIVFGFVNREVLLIGPDRAEQDRTAHDATWQYHAPTRAKLEAADRERVLVTSITDDTMTVRPSPPPDSEPGWDHVPAEYVPRETPYSLCVGDRACAAASTWSAAECALRTTFYADVWIRRASHPERVRWLAERKRAVNTDSAIVAAVDSESTYASAPSLGRAVNIGTALVSRDDAREAVRDATVAVSPDPFAAVRAEAKRMLDAGANPRVVLGALDDCVLGRAPELFTRAARAHLTVSKINAAKAIESRALSPCYHGNRAGTCGWCALSRDRSDARAVASHEPAWETADCEGE